MQNVQRANSAQAVANTDDKAGGMTMATQPIPQHDAGSFDPATWLSALVQIGGGYALASGRKLWLVVQDCPADELTPIMAQIVGRPERAEAVRAAIERRQNGEAS